MQPELNLVGNGSRNADQQQETAKHVVQPLLFLWAVNQP